MTVDPSSYFYFAVDKYYISDTSNTWYWYWGIDLQASIGIDIGIEILIFQGIGIGIGIDHERLPGISIGIEDP